MLNLPTSASQPPPHALFTARRPQKSALTSLRLSHTRVARVRISGVGWCKSGTMTIAKPPTMPDAIRRPRRPSRQRITLQLGQHALGSPSDRAYGQMNARIEHALDGQGMGGIRISCLLKPIFVHKRLQFFSRAAIPVKTRDFIRIGRIGDFQARTSSHLNRRPTRK